MKKIQSIASAPEKPESPETPETPDPQSPPNPDRNPSREKGHEEFPGPPSEPNEIVLGGDAAEIEQPRHAFAGIRHTPLNHADPHPRRSSAV